MFQILPIFLVVDRLLCNNKPIADYVSERDSRIHVCEVASTLNKDESYMKSWE